MILVQYLYKILSTEIYKYVCMYIDSYSASCVIVFEIRGEKDTSVTDAMAEMALKTGCSGPLDTIGMGALFPIRGAEMGGSGVAGGAELVGAEDMTTE